MAELCRLCLCESKFTHSLLEQRNFDMLESLTSIKILSDDSSTVACTKCMDELVGAFNIQQRILETNEKFENMKNEVIIVTMDEAEDVMFDKDSGETSDQPLEVATIKLKQCPVCASFIEESALLKHTKAHFECPQYCDLCQSTFDTMKLYKEHWNNQHTNHKSSHECTACPLMFKYRSILCVHMSEAHDSVIQNAQELEESSILKRPAENIQESLDLEVRAEGNADLNPNSDTSIKKNTRKKPARNQNKGKKDDPEKPKETESFDCAQCQKQFKSKKRLCAHQAFHKPKKTCPICGAQVNFPIFKLHVRKHDPSDRVHSSKNVPVICELCAATLSSTHALYTHKKMQHSEFRKDCEECGCAFTNPYRYQKHMNQHKGKKSHVCEYCGKSFYIAASMNRHVKRIHLKLRPFRCSYCEKAFLTSFELTNHERVHTRETPFKCEVCGEGFREKTSLKKHRKNKHDIVPPNTFPCTTCGNEYDSEHALLCHVVKRHDGCL